eukprot:scaffold122044_cov35-Phaeocystis_antarctica.AAC.1
MCATHGPHSACRPRLRLCRCPGPRRHSAQPSAWAHCTRCATTARARARPLPIRALTAFLR